MADEYFWNEEQKELSFLEVEQLSILIQKLERRQFIPIREYSGDSSAYCQKYHERGLCASCCPLKIFQEPCEDMDKKDVAWFNMAQAIGKREWKVALMWANYLRELASFVAGIRPIKPIRPIKFIERTEDARES